MGYPDCLILRGIRVSIRRILTFGNQTMPTIALVDDDRNILTSVSIALEAEGYRIMTYTDGASALDGFKTSPPDMAIPSSKSTARVIGSTTTFSRIAPKRRLAS